VGDTAQNTDLTRLEVAELTGMIARSSERYRGLETPKYKFCQSARAFALYSNCIIGE